MDKRKFFIAPYITHLLRSGSKYDLHSPFIYKIYNEILKDKTNYAEYQIVETFRRKLMNDNRIILVQDSGAGANVPGKEAKLTVRKIARNSSIQPDSGKLLFRLVRYFEPRTILELGTSLGVSTSYLALGNPLTDITSIEGSRETLDIARKNFKELAIKNIRVVHGLFDEILVSVLAELPVLDLVFFDGNHKKEPTLNYFYQCLQHRNRNSLFIFHDNHWSKGMEQAWREIRAHPSVTVTIDLFRMGLVFFNDDLSKEDFILNWR